MSPLQCLVSNALSTSRENTADAIADICIEEWDTYGILPSVAIGQAFVESGLGSGGSNLFGVNGCSGLGPVSATYKYLQCLHNGYFKGTAAWKKTPEDQMYYILERGNYCAGEYPYGRYYYNVIRSIIRYGWRKYDKRLERKLRKRSEKKLRKKRQRKGFRLYFSDEIPDGTCIVDPGYIKRGSTIIYEGGILDAILYREDLRGSIIVGKKRRDPILDYNFIDISDQIEKLNFKTKVEVLEDAKG